MQPIIAHPQSDGEDVRMLVTMGNPAQPVNKPRIVFFGTPEFGAIILRALIQATYRPVLVVTQPDRPRGRSGTPQPSPVKTVALESDIPVFQPTSLRRAEAVETIRQAGPELIVLAAFGLIIPPEILSIPRCGCINVHPSLLPRHRGPTPVQAAILAGDEVTGVTIMLMDEGLDTGPILTQRMVPILAHDTAGTLSEKLAGVGADLLLETIPCWCSGELRPTPQDTAKATVSLRLRKEDGLIDWSRPAAEIERMIRAYQPWPSAYCFWDGKLLKILEASAEDAQASDAHFGQVIVLGDCPAVVTGRGLLALRKVQLEGRKPTDGSSFLKGHRALLGSILQGARDVLNRDPGPRDSSG